MVDQNLQQTRGLVPVPDPTSLTNDLVSSTVNAAVSRIEARFNGSDNLTLEKFRAIESRFELLDRATIKAAADVKGAVDAAFAAAASGVAQQNQANFLASQKQEAAFTKQIDQLAGLVASISKANDDKLNDLKKTTDDKLNDQKERLVAMESRGSGRTDMIAWSFAALMAIIAMGSLVHSFVPK